MSQRLERLQMSKYHISLRYFSYFVDLQSSHVITLQAIKLEAGSWKLEIGRAVFFTKFIFRIFLCREQRSGWVPPNYFWSYLIIFSFSF